MRPFIKKLGTFLAIVLMVALCVAPLAAYGDDFEVAPRLAESMSSYVAAINNGQDYEPLSGSYDVNQRYRAMLNTKSLIPYMLCQNDGYECPVVANFDSTNLKVSYTQNGDMLNMTFETADYDGWGPCVYIYITPTEAAKNAEPNSVVKGAFYYEGVVEGVTHCTHNFEFEFTLTGQTPPPSSSEPSSSEPSSSEPSSVPSTSEPSSSTLEPAGPEIIENLAENTDAIINALIAGDNPGKLTGVFNPNKVYRGLLMREAMIPYVPCELDGNDCNADFDIDDLKVSFTQNGDLMDMEFEMAQYDGAAWGQCVYLYVSATEKGKQITEPAMVKGTIYYEKDGHRTKAIAFEYALSKDGSLPSDSSDIDKTPSTGDNIAGLAIFLSAAVVCCIMCCVLSVRRRRNGAA